MCDHMHRNAVRQEESGREDVHGAIDFVKPGAVLKNGQTPSDTPKGQRRVSALLGHDGRNDSKLLEFFWNSHSKRASNYGIR